MGGWEDVPDAWLMGRRCDFSFGSHVSHLCERIVVSGTDDEQERVCKLSSPYATFVKNSMFLER